jgi:hypothetical protein
VFGGQTITVNVKLTPSAIQVGTISVTASNPIVPRDQVTSKSIISGDDINNLPIDDVRNIISVQPGVVESGAGMGLVIRGGRPGEANVYIDGVPVRSTNSGGQAITVGPNAVEEASVTTGALGVEFGDAQSGIISYTTRSGGERLGGSLSYATDEPFGNSISVGFNRFEGSIGGPIPLVNNLRFFLSGTLAGRQSRFLGKGADSVPTYVVSGIDTTVTVGTETVNVLGFEQFSGDCASCQGRRLPMDWRTEVSTTGKLSFSYGSGSSVSLTGIASGDQGRFWPNAVIGNPALNSGFHNWARLAILNLNHSFFKSAERELALNLNFSYGTNDSLTGPLDPTTELATRDPGLGLELSPLKFAGFGDLPTPITDQIVRNIRSNTGLRVPLALRDDLRNRQPYRMNPYGLVAGGYFTDGFDASATSLEETRYRGYAQVDWQANRFHRFNFGGELKKTDLAYWSSNLITQIFMDAYVVHPVTYAVWGADRLDLGDVVLELGLRYDYMDSKALFSNTPGRIFTNPAFGQAPNYEAALNAVFTPAEAHSTLSPRLRVSFPITERTDFRLSYSHQVNTPEFTTLLSGSNNDLSFTNTNDAFGRDVGFGKTVLFEFGVRHAFGPDLVLDVAAYNKDFVSELAYRIQPFADPAVPGDTQNINVLTTADFGYARGIDVKLDKRVGNWLSVSGTYTFQVARSTGSDPFSYLRTTSRQISQVTNDRQPPPEQALPTDDNRTHNFLGAFSLTVPADWKQGTTVGAVLRNVGVFATFRGVSGLPYTRVRNSGGGATAPRTNFGLISASVEPVNSSNLPWTKNVDLMVNKGIRLGRVDITAFADLRNAFNFRNVRRLFAETDDVVNAVHRETALSSEFSNLRIEANSNGKLLSDGAIDLRPSCGTWSQLTGAVNCVMLRRTEARFGDGDGVYSLAEQTRALNAFYNLNFGVDNFLDQPRHVRIGFELNF